MTYSNAQRLEHITPLVAGLPAFRMDEQEAAEGLVRDHESICESHQFSLKSGPAIRVQIVNGERETQAVEIGAKTMELFVFQRVM